MILVDVFGHMVATESEEELHEFAQKIGLKREWFQQPKKPLMRHAHYDLTTKTKLGQALDADCSKAELVAMLEKWYGKDFDDFLLLTFLKERK